MSDNKEFYDGMRREGPHAYDDTELRLHMQDRPLKNALERINAHNWDLILLCLAWTNYLNGNGRRPVLKISKYVNPKMDPLDNDACKNISSFISLIIAYGEGQCPDINILDIAYNTTLTLIDRLGTLHPSTHLVKAEEAISRIFYYATNRGEKTMSDEEYANELKGLMTTFITECSANAAELAVFTAEAVARIEGDAAAAIYRQNCHAMQMEEILKRVCENVEIGVQVFKTRMEELPTRNDTLRDKRQIITTILNNRTDADRAGEATSDAREIQRAEVRRIICEAQAKGEHLTLHKACKLAWTPLKGGYPSWKHLYTYCNDHKSEFL